MFKNLLKISTPKKGLREEIWFRLQNESSLTLPQLFRPLILQPAFLVLILVLVGGFSTGVYAYESPAVQEGHLLQPIKHGIETVQVRLARAPEAQARVRLQFAERRLREVEYMKSKRGQFNERAFNQVGIEIERAQELVPAIKNQAKRQAISNHLERVRVLRVRGGEDLIKVKPQLESGGGILLRPSKKTPQANFKKGKELNYLDYLNRGSQSKPQIKYDKAKQNIRSQPARTHNASSIRKPGGATSSQSSKESPAESRSRN